MSDKYKMISELNLEVYRANLMIKVDMEDVVLCRDLESLLANGVRVWGKDVGLNDEHNFNTNSKYHGYTHTALLLDIKPIQKLEAVTVQELIKELEEINSERGFDPDQVTSLIYRIKKAGVGNE